MSKGKNLFVRVEKIERSMNASVEFEQIVKDSRKTAYVLDVLENAGHSQWYEEYADTANNIRSNNER